MKLLGLTITVLLSSLLITSCGQKGSLYIPEKQTPPIIKAEDSTTKPTTTPDPSPSEQTIKPSQTSPSETKEEANN